MCAWLKVSRSGYYAWSNRQESKRKLADKEWTKKIKAIHQDSRQTYGSPRVHASLKKQGYKIGKKRVARLMQAHRLQGRVVKVTRRMPGLKRFIARGENLRLGIPKPDGKDQVWVADITYVKVQQHWRHLITIMDLYSRRILGWSLTQTRTVDDTLKVLRRVLKIRKPPRGLIFHTDRGIEFTGYRFREELKKHHIVPSVNRLGQCTDNGHMESFYHSLKAELIRGNSYHTMQALRNALNQYINQFYNRKRMHSGIEYCAPIEYEKRAA